MPLKFYDHAQPIVIAAFVVVLVLAVVALPYYAGTDTNAKWTACANQCAPMAPAEYERACYCDTHTTLPPEPE